MTQLPDLIRSQHAELRAVLDELRRQPAVTELVLEPQLRARARLRRASTRLFLAQQDARMCHLWPLLRRAGRDDRAYVDRAWSQLRSVQGAMSKRPWYGGRDPVLYTGGSRSACAGSSSSSAGRWPGGRPPSRTLRHIGDYVAWMFAGMAVLVALVGLPLV